MELFTVLPVAEARQKMAGMLPPELRRSEAVSLERCLGRRLAGRILAPEDIPGFARSSVDGYAVRAGDTFGASDSAPAYFVVSGEILMGSPPWQGIAVGEALRIATGAMLPPGADAVLMVEHTEALGQNEIEVYRPVGPGENVIYGNEDAVAGSEIFPSNHLLRPQDLGYLAAMGLLELEVFVPLRVGIISTGDEIVPASAQPAPGQVRDVNSYTLYGQVLQGGGEPVLYGLVKDDPALLSEKLARASQECDLVLVSGGSSVGIRDHTALMIEKMGAPGIIFHGLAVRPGKPTLGALIGQKPVFGLPGHPAAAMIAFDLMAAPLLKFGGYNKETSSAPRVRALLSRSLASAPGRRSTSG